MADLSTTPVVSLFYFKPQNFFYFFCIFAIFTLDHFGILVYIIIKELLMKVKLVKKILNLTEYEKIIVYGKTTLDQYDLMIRCLRNLNELRERYRHYLNNGTFQKERHRQRFYGRWIRLAKRNYKISQQAYQSALNDFCKVVRENAIHIATTPTPQAISRIIRGF